MLVDWATMSSNYANFAGILAGFVFSGIFLLLEDEKKGRFRVSSASCWSAFLDLCSPPFYFRTSAGWKRIRLIKTECGWCPSI